MSDWRVKHGPSVMRCTSSPGCPAEALVVVIHEDGIYRGDAACREHEHLAVESAQQFYEAEQKWATP